MKYQIDMSATVRKQFVVEADMRVPQKSLHTKRSRPKKMAQTRSTQKPLIASRCLRNSHENLGKNTHTGIVENIDECSKGMALIYLIRKGSCCCSIKITIYGCGRSGSSLA